jgi:hypothetical protein
MSFVVVLVHQSGESSRQGILSTVANYPELQPLVQP